MAPRKISVAVVGLGIGRAHVLAYKAMPELFDVKAICSLDTAAARAAAAEFDVPRACETFDEALAMPDVDVIDICTPPYLHARQIKAALVAGKHAIAEKPVAASLKEMDELALTEASSGKRVMPIFQYRFGAGLQKLAHLVRRELTGAPLAATVEVHWRRRAAYYAVPWRGKMATELGGVMTSQAIHALDMLTYICGPAKRVFAATSTRVNAVEVEDCAAATLEFSNGALATFSATLGSAHEISRHRFVFERLVAESNLRPYTSSGDPWTFTPDDEAFTPQIEAALAEMPAVPGVDPSARPVALRGYTPPAGYESQFMAFARAVGEGGALPVTLRDAREAIELLTALYHSAKARQPVELPIEPSHPAYTGWV